MAKTAKKLEKYLIDAPGVHKTSLDDYLACPAGTFLTNVCDLHDSFVHCLNKFTKKADGGYNKDSEHSLRHISVAILSTSMGHFETFQKSLFAGLVEKSILFPAFDIEKFLKHFDKHGGGEVSLSVARLLAFRTINAPVGFVIADSLTSWHNPARVNTYFKAFGCKQDCYGADEASDLDVLWQLRHSIVHTGAWLTQPDAQKLKRLSGFGNKPIAFDSAFVAAVCRRFHKIVKACNGRLLADCVGLLGPSPSAESRDGLQAFLAVTSPKKVWLSGK
jgi:hypothetical protein